jgi:SOS regulatory protein LexA
MDKDLKDKYNKIISFYRAKKRSPSYTEIAKLLGYKSKQSAFKVVEDLIDCKLIKKDDSGKIIFANHYNLKLLGYVEAGFPTPADEQMITTVSLDDYIIENKSASFMLKVSGDSMRDAGIHDGDMIVVERKSEAKTGEIVVANVDNAFTLKYLRQDKYGKYYLEPANNEFTNIYPEGELSVQAVLRAVIRKYN